jgi:signal peptidase
MLRKMPRNAYIILTLFLAVSILLTLYYPGGMMAYALPIVCWATLALTTLYMMGGTEKLRSWTNKRITVMALLAAVFQMFILIDAGLINKFGHSPVSFTPAGIAINLTLVSSTLLGMELSRGYLTKNLSRKHTTLVVAVLTILYTFANVSIFALINFEGPLAYTKFMGENFLPTLTENLLATYLALISGPMASLAYRAPLQAFQWFCPILPDLPWGYAALIGVMTPTIGFIAINMATTQKDLTKAGIPTPRIRTPKLRKSQKSTKGWLAMSIFLVLVVWASSGLFGFYPTIIASGSMTPTMNVGDIAITVSTDPSKIQVGDIIQYWQGQEMNLHRVVEIRQTESEEQFITKGDANNVPDSEPVSADQIRGKLIFFIPKLGWASIALKEFFADAYTFITTLPQTITDTGASLIKNGVYITSALALTAYSCLLLRYKNQGKGGKIRNE